MWSGDGKELIYVTANEMMTVPVKATGSTLEIGSPKPLFQTPLRGGAGIALRSRYGVAKDGRLLMEDGASNLSGNGHPQLVRATEGPHRNRALTMGRFGRSLPL